MATKIEGALAAATASKLMRGHAATEVGYVNFYVADAKDSDTPCTLIIHDGPPEKVYTESELEAERKSNRELVQVLVDALDAEIFWSSWLPMNAMDDADQSECIADGKRSNEALALATSKGYTPTPA